MVYDLQYNKWMTFFSIIIGILQDISIITIIDYTTISPY